MLRSHRILSAHEVALGRHTRWLELEITGSVKNLSPVLFSWKHMTSLFLKGNSLSRLPPAVAQLTNLCLLDLSNNNIRSIPLDVKNRMEVKDIWDWESSGMGDRGLKAEVGDMISLVHLLLSSNQIRSLPYELGKLFRMTTLALQGNPLSPEIASIYHGPNGTKKVMQHLLDQLASK